MHGIPESIEHENLEGTCVGILNEIGCINVTERDIHACHRLKNKKNVVIRFVNRKDVDLALHNRAKLKVLDKEGKFDIKGDIYINESLCRPMQFLYWKVRCAYKGKKIDSYNLWKGKLSIKIKDGVVNIDHIEDLINLELMRTVLNIFKINISCLRFFFLLFLKHKCLPLFP